MMEPEYKVRLLATPAFDITYSVTRFAPVIKAANSPAKKKKKDISTLKKKKKKKNKKLNWQVLLVFSTKKIFVPKVTRR